MLLSVDVSLTDFISCCGSVRLSYWISFMKSDGCWSTWAHQNKKRFSLNNLSTFLTNSTKRFCLDMLLIVQFGIESIAGDDVEHSLSYIQCQLTSQNVPWIFSEHKSLLKLPAIHLRSPFQEESIFDDISKRKIIYSSVLLHEQK